MFMGNVQRPAAAGRIWDRVLLLVGIAVVVGACQTVRDGRVHTLSELLIDDGKTMRPYTEVVGKLPDTGLFSPGLPSGALSVEDLGEDVSWMAAYDFDGDGVLSRREQTHGWLIYLASEKSGRQLAPESLKSFPRTAAVTPTVPAAQSLSGVALDAGGSKGVRAAIDAIGGSASAAMAEVEVAIAALAAEGGDSASASSADSADSADSPSVSADSADLGGGPGIGGGAGAGAGGDGPGGGGGGASPGIE